MIGLAGAPDLSAEFDMIQWAWAMFSWFWNELVPWLEQYDVQFLPF
jgi:hypothetical protein